MLGGRVFPTFDGPTTTWAWSFSIEPPTALEVMHDAAGPAPYFEPDAYGTWTVRFVDDAARVFTLQLSLPSPVGSDILYPADDIQGRSMRLPDTAGQPGKGIRVFGQNTDAGQIGGQAEIAGGIGGGGSFGVVISERQYLGGDWATYQIAQFFANGGVSSEQALVGGSTGLYRFNGPNLAILQLRGGAATALYYDAGQEHRFRTDVDARTTFQVGPGDKVGLFGAAPVVRGTRPGQLTDNTTGTVNGTLVDVGVIVLGVPVAAAGKTNDNFADLADRVNKLEAYLALRGDIA